VKTRRGDDQTTRLREERTNRAVAQSRSHPVISLTTDFGTSDYFVGAMKGAILSVCPSASIIDITHEIPAHDIHSGAFTLLASYQSFPKQTVHVAVVDPGVGSARRPILVQTRDYFFIAPDNGLLSYALQKETDVKVFHLTNEKFFRPSVSATFHGRDVFAPIAGAVASGINVEELGNRIEDYIRLGSLNPIVEDEELKGSIINIDRFGNIVTNILPEHLTEEMREHGFVLKINEHEIIAHQRFYAAVKEDEIFSIWGSAGFLEISAFKTPASKLLNAQNGQEVFLFPKK